MYFIGCFSNSYFKSLCFSIAGPSTTRCCLHPSAGCHIRQEALLDCIFCFLNCIVSTLSQGLGLLLPSDLKTGLYSFYRWWGFFCHCFLITWFILQICLWLLHCVHGTSSGSQTIALWQRQRCTADGSCSCWRRILHSISCSFPCLPGIRKESLKNRSCCNGNLNMDREHL